MLRLTRFSAVRVSPGEIIDQKYRIERILGTGGMGSVYEAQNTRVDRRVAIKVMHKAQDRQDIARFEREARAAQIGSPYIVQVFDLGYLSDGAPYMVMEYLAGESLGERLKRVGVLSPPEVLPIAKQILDALAAAHRAGIIHRDLKPDNVFLARIEGTDEEIVKLLDFGISKFTDTARKPSDMSLTRSGVAVGTPHYMSPEQVQGSKNIDFRTDLYSLGVILYRCLCGQLPFQSEDVAPLLVQILLETPKPLHQLRPETDPELSALVARAMSRQASDRFSTAAEFRAALTDWEVRHSGARAVGNSLPTLADAVHSPHTPPLGTNAPWASTAAQQALGSPRDLRNVVLATVFLLAGVAGLFVAYQIWSAEQAAHRVAAGDSATPPTTAAAVNSPVAEAPAASVVVTATQASGLPRESPHALVIMPRKGNAPAGVSTPAPEMVRPIVAAPALEPVAASSQPPAPPPPAIQSPAPAAPPVTGPIPEDDGTASDDRHISRGVH